MNRNDQEFLVNKIRTQYTEKEYTALDELRELDARVKRPANIFAYIFGSLGALVMGAGMSLIMTDIGELLGFGKGIALVLGIVIGIVGIALVSLAYPAYCKVLRRERERHAPEIIKLGDELLK